MFGHASAESSMAGNRVKRGRSNDSDESGRKRAGSSSEIGSYELVKEGWGQVLMHPSQAEDWNRKMLAWQDLDDGFSLVFLPMETLVTTKQPTPPIRVPKPKQIQRVTSIGDPDSVAVKKSGSGQGNGKRLERQGSGLGMSSQERAERKRVLQEKLSLIDSTLEEVNGMIPPTTAQGKKKTHADPLQHSKSSSSLSGDVASSSTTPTPGSRSGRAPKPNTQLASYDTTGKVGGGASVSKQSSSSALSRQNSKQNLAPAAGKGGGKGYGRGGKALAAEPAIPSGYKSKRPKVAPKQAGEAGGTEGMKTCMKILKNIMSSKTAFPFNQPVDPNRFPDYYRIIEEPMDLHTIKKNLDANVYASPEEFADDVRKVFSNCFVYNPKGSDVYNWGAELLQTFEDKYEELPTHSIEMKMDSKFHEMERQFKAMQKKLVEMQQQQLQAAQQQTSLAPAPVRKQKSVKAKPAEPPQREMNWEEKRTLSGQINKLSSAHLGKIVQIINTNMPHLTSGEDDYMEVDIEALDDSTLWKLQQYVTGCKSKKKPQPRSTPTNNSKESRLQAAQAANADLEMRKKQVEEQLQKMTNGGAGGPIPVMSDKGKPGKTKKSKGGASGGVAKGSDSSSSDSSDSSSESSSDSDSEGGAAAQ